MSKNIKRLFSFLIAMIMVLSMVPFNAMDVYAAEGNAVAKVGNTEYTAIDEAIAAWTNGSTLTLLDNVTLTDVITLKSTEHHILNLGTFTMTAASGKNAIVIKACGNGSAERYAITVQADATNPGGINAGKKSVIYYKYADGGISTEDRPIIKIEGGVFTGSTNSLGTAGIYTIGSEARKCATLNISGGTFNCSINGSGKSKLLISGGTFNYSVGSQGDSTALRLISGGKFKTLGFMTADSNNTKFWFGTSMGNSNVGLFVDKDGYLNVGGPVITEVSAKYPAVASNATKWSSYLAYSAAATNGLFYEDSDMAIKKHGEANVTIYSPVSINVDDEAGASAELAEQLKGNNEVKDGVELPEGVETFVITLNEVDENNNKLTFQVEPKNAEDEKVSAPSEEITFRLPVPTGWEAARVYHEGELIGTKEVKEGNYVEVTSAEFSLFAVEKVSYVAKIGEQGYETFAEALTAAEAMTGDVIVEIYDRVTLNSNLSGSYDSIKFVGKDTDAEIYLDVQGYITATGKKVAFEDLILSKVAGGFITNAGFMNVAFGVYDVTEVTYTNCTFANGAYASSGEVTYTGCTFKRSHDKYGLWAYGNVDVTVDGCTFADYRGIKTYAEGAAKTVDLTVRNTNFSALDSKPAIVLTYANSVTLENNTYSTTGAFELDLDGAPNGTAVSTDTYAITCKNDNGACGVLVDGYIYTTVEQAAEVATEGSTVILLYNPAETVELAEGVILDKNGFEAAGITVKRSGLSGTGTEEDPFLINNVEDLIWFRDKVDEQAADGSTQFAGKYFKLTADIDLAGINWNPIGSMSGDHGSFKGVFDGNGHNISNLNCQQAGQGLGLFARTAGNAEIKNLTLTNVTVKSTNNSNYVGGLVGNAYASTKITNVHVIGTIDISGRGYIGGISGHGYVVMDNVSVVGEGTISSTFWCAAGILGYGGEGATNITNAKVEGTGETGLTITSAAGGLGAIVGMAEDNEGTQPISGSNLSAKNVDIKTYTGAYGDAYSNYALGYLYGGNPTSILTGDLKVEDVTIETSNGVEPEVNDAVASVDGAIYFNLQSAIDAADGKTVKVLRDVALTAMINVTNTVTLDLNGHNLTIAEGKKLNVSSNLTVTGEGTLSGDVVLTKDTATLEGPANLDVTTTLADHRVVYENGVYKPAKINYVAQVGETKYESPAEAFADFGKNDTLKLLANIDLGDEIVVVRSGATLDLNGFTLKAEEVLTSSASGKIIDSSNGAGLLKVARESLTLLDNDQMMVWIAEEGGYRFANVAFDGKLVKDENNAGKATYYFWMEGEDPNYILANELGDGATDNDGLDLIARVSYTNRRGLRMSIDVRFAADDLIAYGNNYYKGSLYVTVSGLDNVSDVTFTPILSNGDVVITGTPFEYN